MSDQVIGARENNNEGFDPNATSSQRQAAENIPLPDNADAEGPVIEKSSSQTLTEHRPPSTDNTEQEKTRSSTENDENFGTDDRQAETQETATEDLRIHISAEGGEKKPVSSSHSEIKTTGAVSPSKSAEPKENDLAAAEDEPTTEPRPPSESQPSVPALDETKSVDADALEERSRLSNSGYVTNDSAALLKEEEEETAEIANVLDEEPPQIIPDTVHEEIKEPSLEQLLRKASESVSQRRSKAEATSLTNRLYEEQIRTGRLNRLTSVVRDEAGNEKFVHPGSVPHWNTVNISLTGKRPMPNEQCRRREHNCFESATARRERALSASRTQGMYPDFMRLNAKLNEFVAASIIEKLRLKGLAAPLHLYKGRFLPSDVLAEMVLKPKKKKVTDRYYFGYVPPPNKPRISAEFRRYLQQFAERHKAAESDLCYSHALKKVRLLAQESGDRFLSLPQTLAEVVRAQAEPGFGVKQLRRPQSAVV